VRAFAIMGCAGVLRGKSCVPRKAPHAAMILLSAPFAHCCGQNAPNQPDICLNLTYVDEAVLKRTGRKPPRQSQN
jgi:hypothetical protein